MKLKHLYYDLLYGVRNLIEYFPLIWRDRDWDHYYLYRMLEFKLRRMSDLQRKYGSAEDAEEYAADIDETADALKRVYEDEYDYRDYLRGHEQLKADLELACENLKTKSLAWWD